MVKFEEHEGKLFRMLDEPVPLTDDAELPVLVRLIQDDSPMGRYNQSYSEYRYGVRLGCCMLPIIATHIGKNGVVNDIEWDINRYEIIGTFVEDGSKEWALYQMMNGEKVCNPTLAAEKAARLGSYDVEQFNTFWYIVDGAVVEGTSNYGILSASSWIAAASSTGWQIYKEPDPQHAKEPIANCENCKHVCTNSNVDHCHMYEPKPKSENIIHGHIPADMHLKYIHLFKVGDWVECKDLAGVPAQCKVLEIRKHNVILECTTGHIWSLPHNNIIRKLSPSEIIVTIGCLSGTIAKSCDPNHFLMLHSRPITDCNYSIIRFSAIDTETRSLVESLLKAQGEESQ